MKALTLEEIRQIVGGTALSPISQTSPLVKTVAHDTRHLESGCLFVAIHGERFDGHDFLQQAAQGGAVAAIVSEKRSQANLPLIQVSDTRIALGKLAAHARSHLRGKVIAVAADMKMPSMR